MTIAALQVFLWPVELAIIIARGFCAFWHPLCL